MSNIEGKFVKTLVIFDCSSIHDIVEEIKKTNKKVKFGYKDAKDLLSDFCESIDWEKPEDKSSIALVTIDQSSERQQLFVRALTNVGILVENVDYRLVTPTQPIGVKFNAVGSLVDLSPYITYILGVKSSDPMNVIIVTRSFGIYGPLMDYVSKRGGNVYLAFFKRFLDYRWTKEITEGYKQGRINFLNLEDHAQEILGIDLPSLESNGGLASI